MRRKSEAVLAFARSNHRLRKSVADWREKCKRISRVLGGQAEMLDVVHDIRRFQSLVS
jgi:hypothetical protein